MKPTQAQYVAAYKTAKQGIVDMVASFGLPGWEVSMINGYITDDKINALSDKIAEAVVSTTL